MASHRHIVGAHSLKSFDSLSRDTGSFFKYVDQMTHLSNVELFTIRH